MEGGGVGGGRAPPLDPPGPSALPLTYKRLAEGKPIKRGSCDKHPEVRLECQRVPKCEIITAPNASSVGVCLLGEMSSRWLTLLTPLPISESKLTYLCSSGNVTQSFRFSWIISLFAFK